MPWTDITRQQHNRDDLRYPSDLRDEEWALIAPLLPPARRGGRPRTTELRDVVNALLYIGSGGCAWRLLPKEFPPRSTVQRYFYEWRDSGLWRQINHLLVMAARELAGREASPSAGVIDSQSVKTTESGGVSGGACPRDGLGPDPGNAGKKVKGRKRHIVTDTLGLMLFAFIHAADIQDRDGAVDVIKALRHRFPWLRHLFADSAYAGEKLQAALAGHGSWTIEIVKRPEAAKGFVLLLKRWVVERTFAWLGRCRRLAKDWERSIESSTAWTLIAHLRRLTRLIARHCYAT